MIISKVNDKNITKIYIEDGENKFFLPSSIQISNILSKENPKAYINSLSKEEVQGSNFEVLAPVDDQEVWGTGVTYFNSKFARNEESKNKTSLYDYVYDSKRPQIFYKSRGRNVIATNGSISLREDSKWTVPEPELVIVMNSYGRIVGYTAGNDVSCRDVEGENALFQLQAKVWDGGCSLGPNIILCEEKELKNISIQMDIHRSGEVAFSGETNTANIVRKFSTLADYLFQNRSFSEGTYLFTGTGIVPEESFSLKADDKIEIKVGTNNKLTNGVI
jgi:2-dehydro-3-deoxy-D-arabinonate dehydratase